MESLTEYVASLPPTWKWEALFIAPQGHEREWRTLLARAQHAEDQAILVSWARRHASRPGGPDEAAAAA